MPYSSRGNLYGLDFLDASTGWAVGQAGLVLKTVDGGVHWRRLENGNLWSLESVHFRDAQHGWAVGDGFILASADGGSSWTPQTTEPGTWQRLHDLAFADATHAAAQRLSLSAVDEAGGSGIASTKFRMDGEAWQSGTSIYVSAPADHSNDGVHLITYFSIDNAGNAESPHTGQVKVDTTAPSTVVRGASAGWQRGPVTLTLVPSDGAGSGATKTEYQLDEGAWTIGTRLMVSGDGLHALACRSVDLAGNAEVAQTTVIRVDSTGPTTAAIRAQGRIGHRISLRYRVADALSSQATHLRVIVRNRKGAVVRRLLLPDASMGSWLTAKWTPKVRGTFDYSVFAKDESGNSQTTLGAARILVR